uniref:DUF2254 domain-containing protein n=1 Tax=Caenorhabditis tropicalis TaxID=1561998 RepID=A0A1I7TBQ5_9PELO
MILLIVSLVFMACIIAFFVARYALKKHFADDRREISSFEVFRPMFQDRATRYEDSRRFEWVHLREFRQASAELPIYP